MYFNNKLLSFHRSNRIFSRRSFRDALAGRFDSYSKTQKRTGKAKPLLHTTALKGDSVVDEASSGPRTASPQLKAAPEAQISLMTTSDKRPNSLLHTECNAIINNMDPVNMDPIAFHGANFTEPATYSDDINQLCNLPDSHSRNEAFHDIEPISFQEAMSQPSILDLPVYPGERPTNIESNTSIAHGEASEDWSSLLEILQSDGSRNPTPSDMGNSFPRRDERGEL